MIIDREVLLCILSNTSDPHLLNTNVKSENVTNKEKRKKHENKILEE